MAPKIYYFEDLTPGTVLEFGDFEMTEEEIVGFARRYDPQPFHLDEAAAKASPDATTKASPEPTTKTPPEPAVVAQPQPPSGVRWRICSRMWCIVRCGYARASG